MTETKASVFLLLFGFFISLGVGADCRPAGAADEIRINGSGSGVDVVRKLAERYVKKQPNVLFTIRKPMGSSGAMKAVMAGALDLAVTSKPVKPEDAALGAVLLSYGKTPLAVVVEKSVFKSDITTQELEGLYAGKTALWPDGKPVRIVLRPQEDIDTKILRTLSPDMDKAVTASQNRKGMIVAITDPEATEMIARTPGSLGQAGLTGIIDRTLELKTLSLNGVAPTPKNLASGTYPLAKDINFVTKGQPRGAVRKFLDFVFSPEGRSIAAKAGMVVTAGK